MKVLISAPRAGSSYFYEQIEKENLLIPNVKKPHHKYEFLNPDVTDMSTREKIHWLNSEKSIGKHYTFKHHINHLYIDRRNYYLDWFVNFYAGDEIIVLKRRNIWLWMLSFLWQDLVGWKTAGIMKSYTPVEINTNINLSQSMGRFFHIVKLLDQVEGNVVYYEDLKYFNSSFQQLSKLENYPKQMAEHGIDLKYIKDYFNKRMAG